MTDKIELLLNMMNNKKILSIPIIVLTALILLIPQCTTEIEGVERKGECVEINSEYPLLEEQICVYEKIIEYISHQTCSNLFENFLDVSDNESPPVNSSFLNEKSY